MFLTFGWKLFLQINENADPLREVKINGDKEAVQKKKKNNERKKMYRDKNEAKSKSIERSIRFIHLRRDSISSFLRVAITDC